MVRDLIWPVYDTRDNTGTVQAILNTALAIRPGSDHYEVDEMNAYVVGAAESDLASESELAPADPDENFATMGEVKRMMADIEEKAKREKEELVRRHEEAVNTWKRKYEDLLAENKKHNDLRARYVELIEKHEELMAMVLREKDALPLLPLLLPSLRPPSLLLLRKTNNNLRYSGDRISVSNTTGRSARRQLANSSRSGLQSDAGAGDAVGAAVTQIEAQAQTVRNAIANLCGQDGIHLPRILDYHRTWTEETGTKGYVTASKNTPTPAKAFYQHCLTFFADDDMEDSFITAQRGENPILANLQALATVDAQNSSQVKRRKTKSGSFKRKKSGIIADSEEEDEDDNEENVKKDEGGHTIRTHLLQVVGLPELRMLIDYDILHPGSHEVAEVHHLAWALGRIYALRPGSIGWSGMHDNDRRNIIIKERYLGDPVLLQSKAKGDEIVSDKSVSAHSLTLYLKDRGMKLGFLETITFYSLRRRSANEFAGHKRVGIKSARALLNHDPETRTLERYYIDPIRTPDVSAIALGEEENQDRMATREAELALNVLRRGNDEARAVFGPLLNATMNEFTEQDESYPQQPNPAELRNHKRRIRWAAVHSLFNEAPRRQVEDMKVDDEQKTN
ncbi:uncharacterized protein B0T23DRAFT_443464 [Neurospora hispaniola]|uniref:Uncharacterized protein n=1 Tax=Neurospora hispaniola TaxID=588809 RepID=A0AAJ0I5H5_9PEZI|nr:hypothetical protein B0T23DRAFT_443464 [Neurospora hispaniola]